MRLLVFSILQLVLLCPFQALAGCEEDGDCSIDACEFSLNEEGERRYTLYDVDVTCWDDPEHTENPVYMTCDIFITECSFTPNFCPDYNEICQNLGSPQYPSQDTCVTPVSFVLLGCSCDYWTAFHGSTIYTDGDYWWCCCGGAP